MITYMHTQKDLPCAQLHQLFVAVGWSDGGEPDPEMLRHFNVPFLNSTLVVSAWEGERLVGAVRVLSDQMIRSVIYDLLVLPEFQGRGIGTELVKRCIAQFPSSEWLVGTEPHIAGYYKKLGFEPDKGVYLKLPCKLFSGGTHDHP